MTDRVRAANSCSREPDPSFTGSGPSGFDPGRKEKRNRYRELEERHGLEDRDLPGGIFDDREDA